MTSICGQAAGGVQLGGGPSSTQRGFPSGIREEAGHTWWGSVPREPPGEDRHSSGGPKEP